MGVSRSPFTFFLYDFSSCRNNGLRRSRDKVLMHYMGTKRRSPNARVDSAERHSLHPPNGFPGEANVNLKYCQTSIKYKKYSNAY